MAPSLIFCLMIFVELFWMHTKVYCHYQSFLITFQLIFRSELFES